MSDWTDELKDQVIKEYKEANPTPDNSMEIVKEIAEKLDKTPNGVRMILTTAKVYVKKTPAAKSSSSGEEKTPRVSKQASIDTLTDTITSLGITADDTILSKLTGKAAVYFNDVITTATEQETEKDS